MLLKATFLPHSYKLPRSFYTPGMKVRWRHLRIGSSVRLFVRNSVSLVKYVSLLVVTVLTMAKSCDYKVYRPTEDRSYRIEWRGGDNYDRCKMGFKGIDVSDIAKKYTVCVESEEFYFQSTGISLKYFTGFIQYLDKVRYENSLRGYRIGPSYPHAHL